MRNGNYFSKSYIIRVGYGKKENRQMKEMRNGNYLVLRVGNGRDEKWQLFL